MLLPVPRTRPSRLAAALLALALVLVAAAVWATPAGAARPNIIIILTDDQPTNTLAAMPNVQSLLVDRGASFPNSTVSNPYCCPSRTSSLSGNYSHTTGVYRNGRVVSVQGFNDRSTLPVWLGRAGYRTGMFGKYMNGQPREYVPPGWDVWRSQWRGSFYGGYIVNERRGVKRLGSGTYINRYLTGQLTSFIRSTPKRQSVFAWFATYGPHMPAIPEKQHAGDFAGEPDYEPASYNEADISDKPKWLRNKSLMTVGTIAKVQEIRRKQLETLQSIDNTVKRIVDTLAATGRLNDTIIIFTSDNGYLHGEHRIKGKRSPYLPSVRVPLVIRWDKAGTAARTLPQMVSNVDLAPTLATLAGAKAPSTDGASFHRILNGSSSSWRNYAFSEHGEGNGIPAWCSSIGTAWQYVQYGTREEELYDLVADPDQLDNLAKSPAHAGRLASLRNLTRSQCRPVPPGYMDEPVLTQRELPRVTAQGRINANWAARNKGRGTVAYSAQLRRVGFGGRPKRWRNIQSQRSGIKRPVGIPPGQTVCLRARAHDTLQNASPWTAPVCSTRFVGGAALRRRGQWRPGRARPGGRRMQSTVSYRAGSTLRTQRVIARQAWISARVCRRCGALEVRWNGRVVRRISLRSRRSRVRTQQVLRFPNMRRGVITLRVVGPRRRAEITGLAVSPFPPA